MIPVLNLAVAAGASKDAAGQIKLGHVSVAGQKADWEKLSVNFFGAKDLDPLDAVRTTTSITVWFCD